MKIALALPAALIAAMLLSAASARADVDSKTLSGLLDQIQADAGRPAAQRVLPIGERFLGAPYDADGPFGEGPQGEYDQNPLYRFDRFDCTTFVETVTALALSRSWDEFKSTINRIRYKDGVVSFVTRNHFTDLDWIPNNVRAGFFRDVTASVAPGRTLIAGAEVDKRAWYAMLPASRIHIPGLADGDPRKQELLDRLRQQGQRFAPETATVPYVPLTALFNADGTENKELFGAIPSGSIVNVVRPNWDLVSAIGTHMNISHQGFAVRKDGVLYFMEASASKDLRKVALVPLADYLRGFLTSPTVKGINVLEIAR